MMFTVATMETNNPILLMGAILINVVCWVVAAIEGAALALAGVIITHARVIAMALALVVGLVVALALAAIFWQAILVTAATFGGMYGGLKVVITL